MAVDSRNLPKNQASRAILIALTDKAFTAVEREAKARGVSPEKLALAALADFLGRNAKTGAARSQPFILHFPGGLRAKIVKAAQTAGHQRQPIWRRGAGGTARPHPSRTICAAMPRHGPAGRRDRPPASIPRL